MILGFECLNCFADFFSSRKERKKYPSKSNPHKRPFARNKSNSNTNMFHKKGIDGLPNTDLI